MRIDIETVNFAASESVRRKQCIYTLCNDVRRRIQQISLCQVFKLVARHGVYLGNWTLNVGIGKLQHNCFSKILF